MLVPFLALANLALFQNAVALSNLIHTSDLQADIAFLASDSLQGRNAGSSEDRIAAEFIASEFQRAGLKPAGDNGTFFQNMELQTASVDRDAMKLSATVKGSHRVYAFDKDFHWSRQSLRQARIEGTVVFAGYGIDAPEYGYNDFATVDIRGKVILVLGREPSADDPHARFAGSWDTYHAFYWQKLEEARKRGAAGILVVQDRIPRDVKKIPASSPRPSNDTQFALAGPMWDIPTFQVSRKVADELLAPSGRTVDQLQANIDRAAQPSSLAVPESSVSMTKGFSNPQKYVGRNVVALLEGSDAQRKSEVVLVSAHHDHMGSANGHIYNGADDDASGVAGLLAIARALSHSEVRPKRSVLFVSFEGEERIFLGSYYYVTHPAAPIAKTVGIINMDMIGRNENDPNWPLPQDGNVNMVNVLGTRYNPDIRRVIDSENAHVGLKLDYKMDVVDPDSLWSRSDHFWFATLHVPQVEFQTGLHPDYHTDRDTSDRINYPKLTKIVQLALLTVRDLANSSARPRFIPSAETH